MYLVLLAKTLHKHELQVTYDPVPKEESTEVESGTQVM